MRKIIFLVFIFGFLVRVISILPANTIIGFDQARDLFNATTIFRDHHFAIIGPTAGNNSNLHHGILFTYYLVFPLIIFKGNPIGAAIFNSFFNALSVITLYFLARDLFKSKTVAFVAAFFTAVSYYFVQFSGWLSNPTGTFFTLPLFFYGIWEYYKRKKWGLPLALFFLGLTIQFELFFVYLIPTGIILWIILRPKFPSIKLLLFSTFCFITATSTMIATEIKFHFAGVKSILFAGDFVGGQKFSFLSILIDFLKNRWETFYLNFFPSEKNIGTLIGIFAVLFLFYEIFRFRKDKDILKRNLFLLVWFFSPAIMFLLGQHNAPWFFIGRPAASILIFAYIVSKIKSKFIIFSVLLLILFMNISLIKDSLGKGQVLLEPDAASIMSDQLKAIDYTYNSTNGESFEINSLTNPLYINAVWGYQYYWYGAQKYSYLPSFAGGEQLYPYNTLAKKNNPQYLFLLMDTTERIPPQFRNEIINTANKNSKLIEEKKFGGIIVQKRLLVK